MTIAGQHSVSELKVLLKNKDSDMSSLAKGFAAFDKPWAVNDKSTHDGWVNDYNNLKSNYSTASAAAKVRIFEGSIVPFVSDDNIPAEVEYTAVVNALLNYGVEGANNPGSLQDLYNRIWAAQSKAGSPLMVEAPLPQVIERGDDTDQKIKDAADKAQNEINKIEKILGKILIVGGVLAVGVALLEVKGIIAPFALLFSHKRET